MSVRAADAAGPITTVAAPTTAMMHIAIQEQFDSKVAAWMEQVTEEQYRA